MGVIMPMLFAHLVESGEYREMGVTGRPLPGSARPFVRRIHCLQGGGLIVDSIEDVRYSNAPYLHLSVNCYWLCMCARIPDEDNPLCLTDESDELAPERCILDHKRERAMLEDMDVEEGDLPVSPARSASPVSPADTPSPRVQRQCREARRGSFSPCNSSTPLSTLPSSLKY